MKTLAGSGVKSMGVRVLQRIGAEGRVIGPEGRVIGAEGRVGFACGRPE